MTDFEGWTAEKAYGDWNVYDGEEQLVAAVHVDDADDQRAAALLMAAAPSMLAVLRLRDELRADGYLPPDDDPRMRAWSAAVAKAMGRAK